MFNRKISVTVCGLLVSLVAPSFAATITTSAFPSDTPGDAFDVSNAGNSYSVAAGTTLASGFDIRDLFGGEFDSLQSERGGVIFADNQSIGTVETVNVTLANAISLKHFDLWVNEDSPSANRSMREFKLFANGTLLDDVTVLDNSGTESYDTVYGGGIIQISDNFTSAPTTANYSLQFAQNTAASGASGLRATEFDGYAPEPSSIAALSLFAFAIRRPRRGLA